MGNPIDSVVDLAKDPGTVIAKRIDSWYNAVTGLGNALRDKLQATEFRASSKITDALAEGLYHDEDIAARIVEALPEDALRRGFVLSLEGEEESDIPKKARNYMKRLKFNSALKECAIWARCFGGAVIYLGIEDGQEESQPLSENSIKSIKFATVLTKRELDVARYYDDPNNEKFGQAELYRLNTSTVFGSEGKTGIEIHESRVLRLDGARTSLRRQQNNNGWHESVLQKVWDVLIQFNVGFQSAGHLLTDAAQGVFKIKNLIDMIAGGDKETLSNRMEVVDMSRSVARAIMLDADMEEFERQSYNFAGVPEMLRVFMLRLAAAARMPVTMLMGQSPAGMNATGESDIKLWYNRVQTYQQEDLLPAIERFFELMFLSADFDGETPQDWEVLFNRLWQMDDKEQAELEKMVAERDAIYIDRQVILPEEVALNRFKATGFSSETQIDIDARKEMLAAEVELAKEKAGEDNAPNSGDATGAPIVDQVGGDQGSSTEENTGAQTT